ncbi:MAG: hypothetical protein M3P53_04685 [Actinomycetota bacterium]|nr:hypothetical protein [Actinomycetota bacterium]
MTLEEADGELVLDPASPPLSPVEELVASAGFLRAGELVAQVAALAGEERAGLARALATHHAQLELWAEQLVVREDLVAARLQAPTAALPGPVGDLSFPAADVAAQIEILAIDTGDDLDTLARGLGQDPALVRGVLDGTIEVLDANQARQLCDALELSPHQVFGVAGAALEGRSPANLTPLAADRRERVIEAIRHELDLEAFERGLVGRDRDHWVERRFDELTDLSAPVLGASGPAAPLAVEYHQIARGEVAVVPFDPFDHEPHLALLELEPRAPLPDLDFGP